MSIGKSSLVIIAGNLRQNWPAGNDTRRMRPNLAAPWNCLRSSPAPMRRSNEALPERDTKVLADYFSAFHHSLVGLTGSPDEIRKVANGYKAFYVKVPDERNGDYAIDHAGVIYLMGRHGEYLGFMPPQTNPDRLTEILRKNLAH
jgi:SCO1/SenC